MIVNTKEGGKKEFPLGEKQTDQSHRPVLYKATRLEKNVKGKKRSRPASYEGEFLRDWACLIRKIKKKGERTDPVRPVRCSRTWRVRGADGTATRLAEREKEQKRPSVEKENEGLQSLQRNVSERKQDIAGRR